MRLGKAGKRADNLGGGKLGADPPSGMFVPGRRARCCRPRGLPGLGLLLRAGEPVGCAVQLAKHPCDDCSDREAHGHGLRLHGLQERARSFLIARRSASEVVPA